MADQKERMEFELMARDMMSGVLKEIGKELDTVNKKMVETGVIGEEAFKKLTHANADYAEKSKKNSEALKETHGWVKEIIEKINNPLGLIGAFAAAGHAVAAFAQERLKLQHLATDVGASAQAVYGLKEALLLGGKEAGEATKAAAGLTGALRDIQIKGFFSDFFRNLQQYGPTLATFANQLKGVFDRGGTVDEALKFTLERWRTFSDAQKMILAEVFGRSISEMEEMSARYAEAVKGFNAEQQRAAVEAAENVNKFWGYVRVAYEEKLGGIVKYILDVKNQFTEEGGWEWLSPKKSMEMMGIKLPEGTGENPVADWWKRAGTPKYLPPGTGQFPFMGGGGAQEGAAGNAPAFNIPSWWTFGAMQSGGKGLAEIASDTNKTLEDIRDLLMKSDDEGTFGAGSSAGGGRRTLARRLGIERGASSRRARPGGGGGGDTGSAEYSPEFEGKGGERSEYLRKEREGLSQELEADPALKREMASLLALEHEADPVAVAESMANRQQQLSQKLGRHVSMREIMHGVRELDRGRSFYGPMRRYGGEIPLLSGKRLGRMESAVDEMLRGSHLIGGFTDQGSPGDPNYGRRPYVQRKGIERYSDYIDDPSYRKRTEDALKTENYRKSLDTGANFNDRVFFDKARLDATVDFKNVPRGVETKVDSDGKFLNLKVNRSTPTDGMIGKDSAAYNPYSAGE